VMLSAATASPVQLIDFGLARVRSTTTRAHWRVLAGAQPLTMARDRIRSPIRSPQFWGAILGGSGAGCHRSPSLGTVLAKTRPTRRLTRRRRGRSRGGCVRSSLLRPPT
jgi:hypothetical protein